MLHFAFELEAVVLNGQPANLRGFSSQDDADLIALPLIRSESGQLQIAKRQHLGFDISSTSASLDFLPEEALNAILSTLNEIANVETKQ